MPRTESLLDLAARIKHLRDTRIAHGQCRHCGVPRGASDSSIHCQDCHEKAKTWRGDEHRPSNWAQYADAHAH